MGARQTIARVHKFPYVPLIQAIGVENVVSTRLSAINSILHAIRRGTGHGRDQPVPDPHPYVLHVARLGPDRGSYNFV